MASADGTEARQWMDEAHARCVDVSGGSPQRYGAVCESAGAALQQNPDRYHVVGAELMSPPGEVEYVHPSAGPSPIPVPVTIADRRMHVSQAVPLQRSGDSGGAAHATCAPAIAVVHQPGGAIRW